MDGFMAPSVDLKNALSPEYSIAKVKRRFIRRSACGSHAVHPMDVANTRHKDIVMIRNSLNRLGPYKLGQAFKYQIPKDTVYSVTRQVDTRDLHISLAPVEPETDLPEFIYFDTKEQTIYGLPHKLDHVRAFEFQLIAEDPITGGQAKDAFLIEIIQDNVQPEDYLFEVTMTFLVPNVEVVSKRSQIKLSAKDYWHVANQIATKLMGNSQLDVLRVLNIVRHRRTKSLESLEPEELDPNLNLVIDEPEEGQNESEKKDTVKRSYVDEYLPSEFHRSHHSVQSGAQVRLRTKRFTTLDGEYFYEFTWTNRSLITKVEQSVSPYGGGSLYETDTCPKPTIKEDIYDRLFPESVNQFITNVGIPNLLDNEGKSSKSDLMDAYFALFQLAEANVEFLSVEWQPRSVCSQTVGIESRTLGSKPIKSDAADIDADDEGTGLDDDSNNNDPSSSSTQNTTPPANKSGVASDDEIDLLPTYPYVGDKMLALIIPPIAIMTALLFAVCIGCCFYRASNRRKALANHQVGLDESPTLVRKRIPIQFEFERGFGGAGTIRHPEAEAMLDPSLHRPHDVSFDGFQDKTFIDPLPLSKVQIIQMKTNPMGTHHIPSQGGRAPAGFGGVTGQRPGGPHPNLQYQMLSQRQQ